MFIVLGLGIIGSATACALARRGHRVIGIDANARGHILGSSHGRTRITRQAYFEAPEYVPLVQHAEGMWRALEAETGRTLFSRIGALFAGDRNSDLVQGSLTSARRHQLEHELLEGKDVNSRFPAFQLPADALALFEPNAGVLHADLCLETLQDMAVRHGAQLHFGQSVTSWSSDGNTVEVKTSNGEVLHASGLVIAAGPWAPQLLAALELPLSVRRMLCVHFKPDDDERFSPAKLPVWCLQFGDHFLYGFPNLGEQGLKAGRHDDGEPCSADKVRREVSEKEIEAVQQEVNQYLPGATRSVLNPVTCLYTDTVDGHFIVDTHPQFSNVAFMAGCSGHAFKFAPALGEALAAVVSSGSTSLPIEFLKANRPGILPALS